MTNRQRAAQDVEDALSRIPASKGANPALHAERVAEYAAARARLAAIEEQGDEPTGRILAEVEEYMDQVFIVTLTMPEDEGVGANEVEDALYQGIAAIGTRDAILVERAPSV